MKSVLFNTMSLNALKPIESYLKSHDYHRLYYQIWKQKGDKGVLIFVHGLNEHCGRYTNPTQYFVKKGYTIYLFDHRGHGKSDGLRSYVDNFDVYLKDLDEFAQFVAEQEKGKKIFMVGHSMGGQIVLNYVGRYRTSLSGFITSSANIQIAVPLSKLKMFLGLNMSRLLPRIMLLNEIDPVWISRDKEVVRAYKRDPLVSKKISLKLASEIIINQQKIMELPQKIKLPALIMHAGDDHICAKGGSQKFYEKLASSDKTLKIYEGCYHELFNELCKEEVFRDMEKWLEKRS